MLNAMLRMLVWKAGAAMRAGETRSAARAISVSLSISGRQTVDALANGARRRVAGRRS